jgi:hypothetical protein
MSFILKYAAVCVGIIIVIGLIVTFAGSSGNTSTENTQSQKAQKEDHVSLNSEGYKNHSTFTGDQSQDIEVTDGKLIFNLLYKGTSKFTAAILNPDGTEHILITNADGPFSRQILINTNEKDKFRLVVKTSGEWQLSTNNN